MPEGVAETALSLEGSTMTLEQAVAAFTSVSAFMAYFRPLIAERRTHPTGDVLSALATAEERGDVLSEDEVLANCVLLLAAGHGTTTHLIGNGLLALLRHPDQLARLRSDPTLAPRAVEELLRYESPVQLTGRVATADLQIGGQAIARGERVIVSLGAANRDPAVFAAPDTLDLDRGGGRHVAFGYGIHFCVGAPLARLEGAIALPLLLERLPGLRLATAEEPLFFPSMTFRGLTELPVVFDR